MAKDPAFLFYPSDFLVGTTFMTNEQVGAYIRLMCLQHQTGRLREKDMLQICKSHDEDIFSKFEKDEEGFYYNRRLEEEINKRASYSESRRRNRAKKETSDEDMKNICNSYVPHMENENVNENINEDVIKEIGVKGKEKKKRHQYGEYKNVLLTDEELEKVKVEFPGDWESRIEKVSEYCASTGKTYKNYLATIRNWAKKDKPQSQAKPPGNYSNQKRYSKSEIAELEKGLLGRD